MAISPSICELRIPDKQNSLYWSSHQQHSWNWTRVTHSNLPTIIRLTSVYVVAKTSTCHAAPTTRVLQKIKKSVTLSVLCPDLPVNTALLSNRWRWYELISSPCSDSPKPLQAPQSVGSSLSWDGPVYSAATFPATILSQVKLVLKERATKNQIKHQPVQNVAADFLPNESHAKANVSLLARLQKLSSATLNTAHIYDSFV